MKPAESDFKHDWPTDPAGLKEVLTKYRISRATAFRWRRLARANPERPMDDLVRKPGRPSARTSEHDFVVRSAIVATAKAAQATWESSRAGKLGRPTKARPLPSFDRFRAAVRKTGVICHDAQIRKILRALRIETAGQRAHRKRQRHKSRAPEHT